MVQPENQHSVPDTPLCPHKLMDPLLFFFFSFWYSTYLSNSDFEFLVLVRFYRYWSVFVPLTWLVPIHQLDGCCPQKYKNAKVSHLCVLIRSLGPIEIKEKELDEINFDNTLSLAPVYSISHFNRQSI